MATSTAKTCIGTTKAGQPCQGWAGASGLCFSHDPGKAAERKEARAKGGRARHGRRIGAVGSGARVEIRDLADVGRLVIGEIGELLTLEKSIARARATGYLAQVLAGIWQASELEQRVAALERVLSNRQ